MYRNPVVKHPVAARKNGSKHSVSQHNRQPGEADLWIEDVHYTEPFVNVSYRRLDRGCGCWECEVKAADFCQHLYGTGTDGLSLGGNLSTGSPDSATLIIRVLCPDGVIEMRRGEPE